MAKQPSAYDFSKWPTKVLGPRPTAEQLNIAHAFSKPGKHALSLALTLRECGVTPEQRKQAVEVAFNTVGKPQNNHPREMVKAGWFVEVPTPAQPVTGHVVKRIKLTPKGEARVKLGAYMAKAPTAAKPEPAKAVKPAKAKKAKAVKPAVTEAVAPQATVTPEREAAVTEAVMVHTEAQGDGVAQA